MTQTDQQTMTYAQACQVIADAWNKELKNPEHTLTGEDIWTLHPTGELFYLYDLYQAAVDGVLVGLLLSDNFYAELFLRKLESKYGAQICKTESEQPSEQSPSPAP